MLVGAKKDWIKGFKDNVIKYSQRPIIATVSRIVQLRETGSKLI